MIRIRSFFGDIGVDGDGCCRILSDSWRVHVAANPDVWQLLPLRVDFAEWCANSPVFSLRRNYFNLRDFGFLNSAGLYVAPDYGWREDVRREYGAARASGRGRQIGDAAREIEVSCKWGCLWADADGRVADISWKIEGWDEMPLLLDFSRFARLPARIRLCDVDFWNASGNLVARRQRHKMS